MTDITQCAFCERMTVQIICRFCRARMQKNIEASEAVMEDLPYGEVIDYGISNGIILDTDLVFEGVTKEATNV
jgi:hypothetical protein